MKSLDIKHLKLLAALAETQSLTMASQRLHLSQPALSHQLKAIETIVGNALFERQGKRMVPNPAGQLLADKAVNLLSELGGLVSDAKQLFKGEQGAIKLSTACYTCYHWLPRVIKAFKQVHPNVDIQIINTTADKLRNDTLNGDIDIAIVPCGMQKGSGFLTYLFDDEAYLLVNNEHDLAQQSEVDLVELTDEHWLFYSGASEKYLSDYFDGNNCKRPTKFTELHLTEAIVSWVKEGLGVSVLPKWAAFTAINSCSVKAIKLKNSSGIKRTWFALSRYESLPESWQTLVNLINELPPTTYED